MKLVGTLHDKQLFAYDPEIKCTESDFENLVSKFSRIETLRAICSMSSQLFHNNKDMHTFGDVPIREDILCDFAYRVIKYCDDKVKQ